MAWWRQVLQCSVSHSWERYFSPLSKWNANVFVLYKNLATPMHLYSHPKFLARIKNRIQLYGKDWAILWMDQFESGSVDEYVLMNMWRSPLAPTSHLSKLSRAHLPLVNFALFFIFLTKHYTVNFALFSFFFLWQNIPENSCYMFSLININHIMWYCDWIHC